MTKRSPLDNAILAEHAAEIRRLGKRAIEDVIEIGRRLRGRKLGHFSNFLAAPRLRTARRKRRAGGRLPLPPRGSMSALPHYADSSRTSREVREVP